MEGSEDTHGRAGGELRVGMAFFGMVCVGSCLVCCALYPLLCVGSVAWYGIYCMIRYLWCGMVFWMVWMAF